MKLHFTLKFTLENPRKGEQRGLSQGYVYQRIVVSAYLIRSNSNLSYLVTSDSTPSLHRYNVNTTVD